MSVPRKKELSLIYNGVNAGKDISPFLESLKYEDATDASDTISMTFSDRDRKWIDSWMPKKEDKITAAVVLQNWKYDGDSRQLLFGDFIVDDFSFSCPPLSCQINGVSAPVNTDFKETKQTKIWEAATVRIIVQEIAGKYGMQMYYDATIDITIAKIEQNEQTDSDFLSKLCEKYGLGMKIYSSRLVIWDFHEYFMKPSIATVTQNDISKWSYKSTMQGTYTGAKVSYTNPKSKKSIEVLVGIEGRLCSINQKADNEADARLIGENAIRNANRKETTMTITILADPVMIASSNINILGLGKMDGKYFIEKVSHTLNSKAYAMQLGLSRIADDSKAGSGNAGENTENEGTVYIVKSGDTLWSISKKYNGNPVSDLIYQANKASIEQAAKAHGKSDSKGGYWIWPGQKLLIPPK